MGALDAEQGKTGPIKIALVRDGCMCIHLDILTYVHVYGRGVGKGGGGGGVGVVGRSSPPPFFLGGGGILYISYIKC